MSNDKMRAEFEAWASTHFFLQEEDTSVDDSDEYISGDMQLAWESWYASRAALSIELPESYPRHRDSYIDVMDAELVVEAIEEAGVRVKQ